MEKALRQGLLCMISLTVNSFAVRLAQVVNHQEATASQEKAKIPWLIRKPKNESAQL